MAYISASMPTAKTGSAFQKMGQFLKKRAAFYKEQRDYRRMLTLSNRELSDMGVTRDDVRAEMMRNVFWNGTF